MVWIDGIDSTIWVCQLNPVNGDLIPLDGRGTRIATSAPFFGDWIQFLLLGTGERGTLNGAEWGNSREGLGVYFTMKDSAGVYQQAKCLFPDLTVTQITFGGDEDRHGNLASLNATDALARLGYYQTKGTNSNQLPVPAYWQLDTPGAPQHRIPLDTFSYNGPRWIPGRRALVTYVMAPDNTIQVAEFNIDTGAKTFLTTGPLNHLDAQVIMDPATGTQKYLLCLETLQALALYEWNGIRWVKQRTVAPPNISPVDYPDFRVTGPRPFIVNGNLFFLYYVYGGPDPLTIYIASGDGTINQRLVAGDFPLFQIDPEVFLGSQPNEVFVYFYSVLPINPLSRLGRFYKVKIVVAPVNP